jgi:hypothetical protein
MRTLRTSAIFVAMIGFGVLAAPMATGATAAAVDQEELIGGIGLRLTEAPVSAGDDPRARVYIVDHLAPGTIIERRIEVSNTTASPQHVALYAAAASIDDGSFVGAAGDTPNELSSWTSVAPADMDVAANGVLSATVIVAIPADAAPGEQYGVIWAEARSDPGEGGGVVQVSRVGIRMYVSVGPGGAPAADFTIDSVTASRSDAEGLPMISANVHNTGGRALDMTGTLTLSNGPGGLSAGPFPADLGRTLAIADTQSVQVMLDNRLPAGPWDASITLESGLTKRTVEASITFPDHGTTAPIDTRSTSSTSRWVALSLLGVALLAAAFGVHFFLRSRRRRRRAVRPWAAPSGTPAKAPSNA